MDPLGLSKASGSGKLMVCGICSATAESEVVRSMSLVVGDTTESSAGVVLSGDPPLSQAAVLDERGLQPHSCPEPTQTLDCWSGQRQARSDLPTEAVVADCQVALDASQLVVAVYRMSCYCEHVTLDRRDTIGSWSSLQRCAARVGGALPRSSKVVWGTQLLGLCSMQEFLSMDVGRHEVSVQTMPYFPKPMLVGLAFVMHQQFLSIRATPGREEWLWSGGRAGLCANGAFPLSEYVGSFGLAVMIAGMAHALVWSSIFIGVCVLRGLAGDEREGPPAVYKLPAQSVMQDQVCATAGPGNPKPSAGVRWRTGRIPPFRLRLFLSTSLFYLCSYLTLLPPLLPLYAAPRCSALHYIQICTCTHIHA